MWGRRVGRDDCGMLNEQPGQIRTEERKEALSGVIVPGIQILEIVIIERPYAFSLAHSTHLEVKKLDRRGEFPEGCEGLVVSLPWAAPSCASIGLKKRAPAHGCSRYASAPVPWCGLAPSSQRMRKSQPKSTQARTPQTAKSVSQSEEGGARGSWAMALPRYPRVSGATDDDALRFSYVG